MPQSVICASTVGVRQVFTNTRALIYRKTDYYAILTDALRPWDRAMELHYNIDVSRMLTHISIASRSLPLLADSEKGRKRTGRPLQSVENIQQD